jgi:hypothetical protein
MHAKERVDGFNPLKTSSRLGPASVMEQAHGSWADH